MSEEFLRKFQETGEIPASTLDAAVQGGDPRPKHVPKSERKGKKETPSP